MATIICFELTLGLFGSLKLGFEMLTPLFFDAIRLLGHTWFQEVLQVASRTFGRFLIARYIIGCVNAGSSVSL